MRADVVVVGGGVIGLATAWHAARRADPLSRPVVLLEKRSFGAGSSGRSGAILRQHYSDRELVAIARDSLRVYAGLEAATGRSIGFERCGAISLAAAGQEGQRALLERNAATMRELGVDARLVEGEELRSLVPGIDAARGTLGLWEPDAGAVDPLRTLDALAALARENGAVARVGVAARALAVERGRVVGVETDDGRIEARAVVVAAGPWTRDLLARAGVPFPLRVVRPLQHFVESSPIEGAAGRAALAGEEAGVAGRFARTAESRSAHPVILDLELGFYARCEPWRGRARVGSMSYDGDDEVPDPDRLDERVDEGFRAWARERLVRRMPAYGARADAGAQAAMYTLTPDAQALIGPIAGIEGAYVVSGFSGHGFKLAPSIGEGVAQMVAGEPVGAFDAAFFDPRRFARAGSGRGGAFGL